MQNSNLNEDDHVNAEDTFSLNNDAICSLQRPGSAKDDSLIFSNNSSKIIHIEREQILLKEIVGKLLLDFRILESKFEIFQNDKRKQEHQQKQQQQQQQQQQQSQQQNKYHQIQGCNTTQPFWKLCTNFFPFLASQFFRAIVTSMVFVQIQFLKLSLKQKTVSNQQHTWCKTAANYILIGWITKKGF